MHVRMFKSTVLTPGHFWCFLLSGRAALHSSWRNREIVMSSAKLLACVNAFLLLRTCKLMGHSSSLYLFLAWNKRISVNFFNHSESWPSLQNFHIASWLQAKLSAKLHQFNIGSPSMALNTAVRLLFISFPFRLDSSGLMFSDLNFDKPSKCCLLVPRALFLRSINIEALTPRENFLEQLSKIGI